MLHPEIFIFLIIEKQIKRTVEEPKRLVRQENKTQLLKLQDLKIWQGSWGMCSGTGFGIDQSHTAGELRTEKWSKFMSQFRTI